MKKKLNGVRILLGLVFGVMASSNAPATSLLEEPFSYTTGNLGVVGGAGSWDSASSSLIAVASGSLAGPTGFPASVGNMIALGKGYATNFNTFAASGQLTSGQVYFSFLFKPGASSGASSSGLDIAALTAQDASTPAINLRLRSNGGFKLGAGKADGTVVYPTATLTAATTYLVVGKYDFSTSPNTVSVWLLTTFAGAEAAAGTAAVLINTGTDFSEVSGIGRFYLNGAGVPTASVNVDELRIGLTWADVMPTEGVPPVGAPYITQVLMTPGGLVLRGTNGLANGAFDLLATTNPASPISQWAEIASDNFNAGGQFDLTNPVTPGTINQFFRLRVGSVIPPPVAPAITTEPTNQMVQASQSTMFTVTASGTAPLFYQWYFNTNAVLSNATSSTLLLNNIQTNDAGSYSVIVTNSVGSATSMVATLTVSNTTTPPAIMTQPLNQSAAVGQTAVFSVVAVGAPSLSYQWYFNTNVLLADATNASLALNNVQTTNAGVYSVLVTNSLGATNSLFVTLTVTQPSTNTPDFSHVGFGNNGSIVTGAGPDAPSVIVTTGEELNNYSDSNSNIVIYVLGTLQISGMNTHVRADKTIIGLGTNAILEGGGLYLSRSTNIIIRNLTIRNSTEDNIGLHYSANVWIDHCTLYDSADGNIDLTQESDNVTISWCKFFYTGNNGHDFVNLLGANDGETGSIGKLRVTFHHNWWSTLCVERMPSVRFGRAHVYNNYYNAPGNNYCVRSRLYAECRVENNAFENVKNPWEVYLTSGLPGLIYAVGNSFTTVTWTANYPATDPVFAPPYPYAMDAVFSVPNLVTTYAGAGKITITP